MYLAQDFNHYKTHFVKSICLNLVQSALQIHTWEGSSLLSVCVSVCVFVFAVFKEKMKNNNNNKIKATLTQRMQYMHVNILNTSCWIVLHNYLSLKPD